MISMAEITEACDVFTDDTSLDAQLSSLLFASHGILRRPLVPHANPQLVHLRKVVEEEVHGMGAEGVGHLDEVEEQVNVAGRLGERSADLVGRWSAAGMT